MAVIRSSLEALTEMTILELRKEKESEKHGKVRISIGFRTLANAINSCTIQGQCELGCGFRVEAYGNEATSLHELAKLIESLLDRNDETYSSHSAKIAALEILLHPLEIAQ